MELREYFTKHKIAKNRFCKDFDIDYHTLNRSVLKQTTPNLLNALKMWIGTNGEVTFKDLLSDRDYENFLKFARLHVSDPFKLIESLSTVGKIE